MKELPLLGRCLVVATALVVAASVLPPGTASAGEERLVVVELFTSQGCNSCPPADAFLGELAERPDVLPLSIHVNYWDYLGWRDTFATEDGTARQRRYREQLGLRYVYTPQSVIGGRIDAVGSHRSKVEAAIDELRDGGPPKVKVELSVSSDDEIMAQVSGDGQARRAELWLVRYDRRQAVEIARGENAGRTLTYHNVVRDITRVGDWTGEPIAISLAQRPVMGLGGRDACALLVQDQATGEILGAARVVLVRTE